MTSSRTLWRLKQWRVFLRFWSIKQLIITTLQPKIKDHNVCIPHSKNQNEWNHYTGIIQVQTLPDRAKITPILTKWAIILQYFMWILLNYIWKHRVLCAWYNYTHMCLPHASSHRRLALNKLSPYEKAFQRSKCTGSETPHVPIQIKTCGKSVGISHESPH